MLVLSRRPGESIHLGENIIITVLEVRGNQIRLGIAAPANVEVLRGELYQALRQQWLDETPTGCEHGNS